MPDKLQNNFRKSSIRHQKWEYCRAGAYFISIYAKGHRHYFGEIKNGEMILSNIAEY